MGKKIRMLIVEDSEDDALLVVREMKRGGYRPQFERVDTKDAMSTALDRQNWDIIITDYSLPHFSGAEALKLIKDKNKDIPFLIVSGKIGEETAVELMKAGACDYIMKDNLSRLVPIIERDLKEADVQREHRRAKEALQKSEERYRRITEAITDYIYTVRIEAGHPVRTSHSETCSAVTGFSSAEFDNDPYLWIRMVVDEDRLLVRQKVAEVLSGRTPHSFEHRIIRKDGVMRWVESNFVPHLDEDGVLKSYDGIIRDITERKEVEKSLHFSEEKFSKAFQASPTFIMINTLKDGMFIDVNEAFLEASGYGRDEIIGSTFRKLGLWSDPADSGRIVMPLRAQGLVRNQEVRLRVKSGDILTVLFSAEKIDIEGEHCVLCVAIDITERKKLENQLLHSQKMEAIGQLAGGIAHDFNNILSAIVNYAYLAKKKMGDTSPIRDNIEQIISLSSRAAEITRGLLAFSRKHFINPLPLDLNSAVINIHKLLAKFLGEDITIDMRLTDKKLVIMADIAQIEQIIINLATNARDAMPDGGSLTLETDLVALESDFVEVHGFGLPGCYAMLSVSDTGTGMDEETRQKAFEPFFTTKDPGRGTGLGLAIIYGIVKQHDGYITVYSEKGAGTTFKVYFHTVESDVRETAEPEFPDLRGNGETILLAEDEEEVRKTSKIILEKFGYTVIEAGSGKEAIERYRKYGGRIRLLVLDVIMPDKNGHAVYEEIKKTAPDVEAIFISGYSAEIMSRKGALRDNSHYIVKPILPEMLLKKIKDVIKNGN